MGADVLTFFAVDKLHEENLQLAEQKASLTSWIDHVEQSVVSKYRIHNQEPLQIFAKVAIERTARTLKLVYGEKQQCKS